MNMNMTSVLHRSRGTQPQSIVTAGGPVAAPAAGQRPPGSSWPRGARALVAVLMVATVVSTIAAVVAAGDGGDGQRALRERIAELSDERTSALDEIAAMDVQLNSLRDQLAQAIADGGELSAQVDDLQTEIAAVTDERANALARVDELRAELTAVAQERATALARIDELTAAAEAQADDLAGVRARLAAAIAERDELIGRLPTTFDVSLVGVDLAGDYRVKVTDVVGTTPKFTQLTITRTKEGWLTVRAPGLADGGFTMVDGVLQMVAGSTTAAGTCDGVARPANVVMTLVPRGYQVGTTGARTTGFDALITVIAPAAGTCGPVVAMSNATLTPIP